MVSRLPAPPPDQPVDNAAQELIDAIRAYAHATDGRDLTAKQRSIGVHHIRYAAEDCFDAALSAYRDTTQWADMRTTHGMSISSLQGRVQRHRGTVRGTKPGPPRGHQTAKGDQ